ncbi:hypothetical protein, partial [Burkholderia contaminans]|uniref:hypothetical protein n=1 Tax=Burkholderia contaminans TaxID=488447 RepID=UPI0025543F27
LLARPLSRLCLHVSRVAKPEVTTETEAVSDRKRQTEGTASMLEPVRIFVGEAVEQQVIHAPA